VQSELCTGYILACGLHLSDASELAGGLLLHVIQLLVTGTFTVAAWLDAAAGVSALYASHMHKSTDMYIRAAHQSDDAVPSCTVCVSHAFISKCPCVFAHDNAVVIQLEKAGQDIKMYV